MSLTDILVLSGCAYVIVSYLTVLFTISPRAPCKAVFSRALLWPYYLCRGIFKGTVKVVEKLK